MAPLLSLPARLAWYTPSGAPESRAASLAYCRGRERVHGFAASYLSAGGTHVGVTASAMATEAQQTSGPNPLCEIGRNHPRDRHRMRPVADHPGVWECPRHDLYATIVSEDVAATLDRGDPYVMQIGRAPCRERV